MLERDTAPFFSIIVPCYNGEAFVAEAIESVRQQSFSDFEIIVVNDGSKDQSKVILTELETQLPYLTVFHQENGGLPNARNAALEHASGQWIVLLDADDKFTPDRLEQLAELINTYPEHTFFFHDAYVMDDKGKPGDKTFLDRNHFLHDLNSFAKSEKDQSWVLNADLWQFILSRYTWLLPITICVKSNIVQAIGVPFDERLIVGEDVDFCIRCLMQSGESIYLNEPLAHYRSHGDSITHDDNYTFRREVYFDVMKTKFYSALNKHYQKEYTAKHARHCMTSSYLYRKRGDHYQALKQALKGFLMRPRFEYLKNVVKALFP